MLLRLYIHLLNLYPQQYQKRYRTHMVHTMQDILTDEPHPARRTLVLLQEIVTTPLNAAEEYIAEFSRQRHITSLMVLSLSACALLVPFVIAIIIDEVTELVTSGSHLYNGWVWSRPVLFVWIVVLPFLSLALAVSAYIVTIMRQRVRKQPVHLFAKRYWLLFSAILCAAGILSLVVLPDTVHCLFEAPNHIVSCTESGIFRLDLH